MEKSNRKKVYENGIIITTKSELHTSIKQSITCLSFKGGCVI